VATLQTPPLLIDEQTGKPGEQPVTANSGGENGLPPPSPAVSVVHNTCHNSATHA
jgi:hypothetical protein